ncbi:MAG: ferritin-like domain-containing protein [Mycobacterium sp.]
MTSPQPAPTPSAAPDPNRPDKPEAAALYDAVAIEHATIYGYGIVSAHCPPEANDLVSEALAQHRERREAALKLLAQASVKAPQPAAGYQLPIAVTTATDAANLAVRMEADCAVAWRAVIERSASEQDRAFAVDALTRSAVLSARWKRVLGAWPITTSFPGGSE